ncbi:Aste57867_22156 [Aphanomyces stellatus]|uniref:Aste57867_22156 protein n=1 Tax=Aphanomyces stellatus TaxID=120398 RepID=A0A485LLF6_9STRA|nr:hypothetical protein As57867_022087 [Aphanomyces stellatus]KAF0712354.1 hypothetical protein As57867_004844 [Aphanomyces stellatus]VFT81950.1 Aste57867_4857 [Aphanomyces stellatus]VFT98823.1 Aste57867_22156 [Aphanomyces stellatus]
MCLFLGQVAFHELTSVLLRQVHIGWCPGRGCKETGNMFAVKIFKKDALSAQDEKDIHSESYYTEKEARDLVKTLLLAIKYCHDQDIVHRDLKPENILMTDKENNSAIKIADFGFAKEDTNGLTTTCGSPEYVAPEIISRSDSKETYGKPVDIWSIGVITYVLLAGYTPFHDDNQSVLFDNICNGRFYFYSPDWDEISEDAKEFVSLALTIDPLKRPSARDLLNDPWITQDNVSMHQLSGVVEKLPMLNSTQRKFKAAVQATILVNKLRNRNSVDATGDAKSAVV